MNRIIYTLSVVFVLILNTQHLLGQQVIPLYPDLKDISVSESSAKQNPTLEIYLPPKNISTGTAVIIFPGGAYSFLAYTEEGTTVAKYFVEKGIAAFVVKYRLPTQVTAGDRKNTPLMDAQQSIKLVRRDASKWNLDPNKIGAVGFSAGGHLASTLGTQFTKNYIPNSEGVSLRPDFMILVYPVISMDARLTHLGTRQALLGKMPNENEIWTFSSDKQVSFDTPPTYLTHTGDDQVVSVNNSIEMYKALVNNNVPAEMHLFPKGNHGFTQRLPVNEWLDPILAWLQRQRFYNKPISK